MKRILLKGYYGFGNLGDDILMKVSYTILKEKYPDASISIFSENTPNNPNFTDTARFNHYIRALLENELPLVDWTDQSHYDLLFNGGGGIYKDHSYGNWQYIALNAVARRLSPQRIRQLENSVRERANKPSPISFDRRVGFGLSIGPFRKSSPSYVRKVSELGSYDELFVRDEASMNFLKTTGFASNYYRTTDIAFLSDYWLPPSLTVNKSTDPRNIGVILLDWHENNDIYFKNIKQVVKQLEQDGYEVSFFSFQEGYDQRYQGFFQGKVIAWNPNKYSLEQFLFLLRKQHLIITARAHGAIIGACLGVPSICLGVTLKLEEVSKMLLRSSSLIAPPFCPTDIVPAVQKMVGNYPDYLDSLQVDLCENKKQIDASVKKLLNTL
ncbi:polysaccharide pyruvyl transferase family protein [Tunicatimonas pelagia]|uniref:polysaccharide pyruvyl transferase family protein n=1 Tax=Tunicatimonas pelagia TaxID=931531 RepID=UPI0026671211|nr:polysaccharide pyruvyl transferase family protein [Tunicatimonas pelagia]WKN44446.1 polysaccharide pyruvyl transferase family protein [Tunicatimonas pelagia]